MSTRARLAATTLLVAALVAAGFALRLMTSRGSRAAAPVQPPSGAARGPGATLLDSAISDARTRDSQSDTTLINLRGVCTDLTGAPIDGRGVTLRLFGPTHQVVSVPVRADGSFTAPMLESGAWRIECRAPGFHHAPFGVDAREVETHVDVVLEKERTFDVVLVDQDGQNLVDALDPDARASLVEISVRARGDAWQRYERPSPLASRGAGQLTVLAGAPLRVEVLLGDAPIEAETRVTEEGVLEVRIDPARIAQRIARIGLTIVESETRKPLLGALVTYASRDRPLRGVRTGADGRAAFWAVSSGRITVECAGHATIEHALPSPTERDVDLGVLELEARALPSEH